MGKTASYKIHTFIVKWTNSYIQICLYQISQETVTAQIICIKITIYSLRSKYFARNMPHSNYAQVR
jgi:hypothetical protein